MEQELRQFRADLDRAFQSIESLKQSGGSSDHGNSAHTPNFLPEGGYSKGNIVVALTSGLLNALPVGVNGDVFTPDSAASRGVKWNSDFNVGASKITFGAAINTHKFLSTSMTFDDLTDSEVFFFDANLMRIQRDLDLNGVLAIGDAPIDQLVAINIDTTIGPSSGTANAIKAVYHFGPTAPGLTSEAFDASVFTVGSQPIAGIFGVAFNTQHQGSGVLTQQVGGKFTVSTGGATGDITNAFAAQFESDMGGASITMNSLQGINIKLKVGSGITIGSVIGQLINLQGFGDAVVTTGIALQIVPIGTGPTNRYGISQESANDLNWFRGAAQFGGSSRPTAIGSDTSQLVVESTTKDFLPPRLTTAQVATWLASAPQAGGMVYNTSTDQLLVTELVGITRRGMEQRKWYSVRDFGAVGDGSADDTTAINNAITEVNGLGGGVLFFPEGIYKTKTPIVLRENVLLMGEGYGSTIRLSPDTNIAPIDCIQTTIDDNRWGICNLHLQAGSVWTDALPAGAAIHVRNGRQYYIGEIWIDGESVADRWSWGLYVDDDDNEDGVADGQASRVGYYDRLYEIEAISSLADSAGIRLKVAVGGAGHYFMGGGTIQTDKDIDDNDYATDGDKGLWIEGIDGFRMVGYEIIEFKRCVVLGERTASGSGINVFGPAHLRWTDCAFEAQGTAAQDGGALWADFASHVMFVNTTLYGKNAAGAWEVFLDDTIQNWFFSNCDIGIQALSAGAIRLANSGSYTNYLVRFGTCSIGLSDVDVGLRIEQDVDRVLVSNCAVDAAIGIQAVGTHAIALLVSNTDLTGDTPVDWQNTGSRHDVAFENCKPGYVNTDLMGDSLIVKEDFATGGLTSGQIGTHGWHFSGGVTSYDINVSQLTGHPGIILHDTGTTIDTECFMWMQASFLFAGIELLNTFDVDDFFEIEYWVRYNSTSDLDLRIGLSDRRNAPQPDDGLYFEHLAADTNFFAVARSGGTETRTDTTIALDTGWHKLTIRRSGSGNNIEYLIDGTVRATITSANVMTGIAGPWRYHKNTTAVSRICRLDSAKLRIPIFGR